MLEKIRKYLPESLNGNLETTAFLGLAGCIAFALISVAISQIFLAVALIAAIPAVSRNRRFLFSLKWVLLPLVLFCIWIVVAALMAPDIALAITITKKFYLFLLIPLVPLIARGKDRLFWICKAVYTTAVLSAVVGIFQYFLEDKSNDLLNRISGFMGHWMTYSGLLMLALILLLAYGLRVAWHKYILWVPFAALIALAIVLSKTRSAVLGVYFGVFFLLLLAFILERKRRFIVFFAGFILFSACLYFVAPASMQQRFRSGLNPDDPNTRNRIELMETSVRMIRDNPLFGVGPKHVKSAALKYRNQNEFPNWMYQHMHNNVLQIAAEFGLPGLALWLWLMFQFAWHALRVYRFAASEPFPYGQAVRMEAMLVGSAALGCWAALMVAGMFEFNFGDSEVLTLFLFTASAPYACPLLAARSE